MSPTEKYITDTKNLILKWSRYLNISIPVETQKVSRWQVSGDNKRGYSMVGVVQENGQAIIIHTRKLTEEDIIHELLHIANPLWEEDKVIENTSFLLHYKS